MYQLQYYILTKDGVDFTGRPKELFLITNPTNPTN